VWCFQLRPNILFFISNFRFIKAKADLTAAEKKLHQLETRNNELTATVHQLKADLARANDEKKVFYLEEFICLAS
jgi:cell division protein FtsB